MATATRKKSPAYEAGVREGAALKKRGSKGAKVEIEISPENEEEMESPENEEEMDSAKGRKRDGSYGKKLMDAPCTCGKKRGKAKCDGSCGKKMDRNDALTPQEYLVACELGIQGRSRSYIRARLDATERLDKKCGASGIPDHKKCKVGGGSAGPSAAGKPGKGGSGLGTALALGLGAAALGVGGNAVKNALENQEEKKGALKRINRLRQKGERGRRVARSLMTEYAASTSQSAARQRREVRNRKSLPPARSPQQGSPSESAPRGGRRVRRQGKVIRLNSLYADGFAFDPSVLAI